MAYAENDRVRWMRRDESDEVTAVPAFVVADHGDTVTIRAELLEGGFLTLAARHRPTWSTHEVPPL